MPNLIDLPGKPIPCDFDTIFYLKFNDLPNNNNVYMFLLPTLRPF